MWIARHKDGELWLYESKPHRGWMENEGAWIPWKDNDTVRIECMPLNSNDYPNLKWEDEPIEVDLWTMEYWKRTIDDIVHKYIAKNDSGEYDCTNDIINSIIKEICG